MTSESAKDPAGGCLLVLLLGGLILWAGLWFGPAMDECDAWAKAQGGKRYIHVGPCTVVLPDGTLRVRQ
jgi:hypothetical protein